MGNATGRHGVGCPSTLIIPDRGKLVNGMPGHPFAELSPRLRPEQISPRRIHQGDRRAGMPNLRLGGPWGKWPSMGEHWTRWQRSQQMPWISPGRVSAKRSGHLRAVRL